MNREKQMRLLYFAFFILLIQSLVSVYLFSKTNPDGGYWPFVLAIVGLTNIFYSTFCLWLVQIGYVRPLHASISILALSASLFLLHNFARIFGTEGHAVLSRLGLDGILQSDMTQYFLYAIFLSEILGTKLMETRKA